MRIHGYFRSSAAYRVRIALNLKQVAHELTAWSLPQGRHRSEEYRALNPQCLVPALEREGMVLPQSLAILEYLEETHPQPALLPPDAEGRAMVRALALTIACDIHPLNNLRVLNYLRREFAHEEPAVEEWYRHWVAEGFAAVEALLKRHSTSGRFCFGEAVTLADVCLVPQVYNARRFKCPLDPYPTLVSIAGHLEALPAFEAARPEAQADAA